MTRPKKKVYISGAISDCDPKDVQIKFNQAKEQIKAFGHTPISPTENGLPPTASWREHMAKDIAMLFYCDAVYVLTDYETSKGARIELFIANELCMDIIKQPQF